MEGYPARLLGRRRPQAAPVAARGAHAGEDGRGASLEAVDHPGSCEHLRGPHGIAGGPDGESGATSHLHERLAGGRRQQHGRPDLPRPEPLSVQLGAGRCEAPQQRPDAGRSDPSPGGERRDPLVRPHHRGRRGGFRRPAACLRAYEGDDRGGGGRRPLRGPTRQREEMRSPRRQGPGADFPVHPDPAGRPPRRRRHGCSHGDHRPDGRLERSTDHQRRGRARSPLHYRRAHP